MSEKLNNHETESGDKASTEWDALKEVPMTENANANSGETETRQYETELTSSTDILEDVKKFTIKDGKVFSKETGQEETDEDAILRIKTSKLLFNEARTLRDRDSKIRGERFVDRGPDYFVDKVMDRYGFKDEDTKYAEGKLLKELVDTGSHHQTYADNNLADSMYDMFIGAKGDLGKALLERRLKQHGLKMIGFNLGLDDSTFQKLGHSTVDIKVATMPLAEPEEPTDEVLHHPAAEQLKRLEAELARAEQDDDETAINGCKAAMKMVVERNQLEVSPEEWNKMSDSNRERFYKLKMKEAKILGDRDSFNFWNANFKNHHQ